LSDKYEGMVRPEKDYFKFLADGKFMILRAKASGQYIFHPRVAEPVTGDTDLEWVEASGQGTVYSTTVTHVRPPKEPYNVALIDLAEGPRMMSRVDGIPAGDVKIGMKVTAKIITENEQPLLVFEPS